MFVTRWLSNVIWIVYESEYDMITLCHEHVYAYTSRQAYDDTLLPILIFSPDRPVFRIMLRTWHDFTLILRLVVLGFPNR